MFQNINRWRIIKSGTVLNNAAIAAGKMKRYCFVLNIVFKQIKAGNNNRIILGYLVMSVIPAKKEDNNKYFNFGFCSKRKL